MNLCRTASRSVIAAVTGLGLSIAVLGSASAAPPPVVENSAVTVVIGDLPGMVNRVAELGNRVNPAISGQMLRAQFGRFLGDEGMRSIPAGAGLIISAPLEGEHFALLETAEGENTKIAEVLQQREGMAAKASGNNLVIVSKNDQTLESLDEAQTSAAAEMLKASNDPFLLITIDADQIAARKGSDIEAGLNRMANRVAQRSDTNSSGTARLIKLLGSFLLEVAERTDVATVKVDVSAEGVVFDRAIYPKGGINLAPPKAPSGEQLRKGLIMPSDGSVLVTFDSFLDTESALEALQPLFTDVLERADVSSNDAAEMKKLFDLGAAAYGDGMTGWASLGSDGATGAYIVSLLDADNAMAEIEAEISSLSTGTLSRLYNDIGLKATATLQKNTGTVQGQPVHTFTVKAEATGGKNANLLSSMHDVKDGKFTFQGFKMLLTLGGTSIEELAASVANDSGNAQPVKARSKLQPGGFVYVDFYPRALSGSGMIGRIPFVKGILDAIGDEGIYQSAHIDNESIRTELLVPGELIERVAKHLQQRRGSSGSASGTTGSISADQSTTSTMN